MAEKDEPTEEDEAAADEAILPAQPCLFTGYSHPIVKWRCKTGGAVRSSPVVGGNGTVYFGSDDGHFYALSPDGAIKWQLETGSRIASPAYSTNGFLCFGSEKGGLLALSPDGVVLWQFPVECPIRTAPAIGSDESVYVTPVGGTLYALSPAGKPRWHYDTGRHFLSSPAIGPDGIIYVGSDEGYLYAFYPDGRLKWSFQSGFYLLSSPVLNRAGELYVGSGHNHLLAITPKGEQKWQTGKGNHLVTRPAIGPDGTICAGSDNTYLFAVAPDGTRKWGLKTGDWITASPLSDALGVIYVGSWDHYFYAVTPEGKQKWRVETGGAIRTTPAISPDGTLYFGSDDGHLYAIGHPADRAVLFGQVTDTATGKPVSGAEITISGTAEAEQITATSPTGEYAFAPDAGTCAVRVSKPGYQPLSLSHSADAGAEAALNIGLPPIGPLEIPASPLPVSAPGEAYNARIPASGGTWPYIFSVAEENLPPGVVLDPRTGVLSGAPDEAGEFLFTAHLQDADGSVSRREFGIDVIGGLEITTPSPLPVGTVGAPYVLDLEATWGNQVYRFSPAEKKSLPPGLKLSKTGTLSGTPAKGGTFEFNVAVSDGKRKAEKALEMTVADRLVITTRYLHDGVSGIPYKMELGASGGGEEKHWSVSGLPPGLSFSEDEISGTPTEPADTVVEVALSDAAGRTARKAFPLEVARPLAVLPAPLPTGVKGVEYSGAIEIIGGIGPFRFSHKGKLPKGLSLNPETGVISGTPAEAVWTNILLTVEDSAAPVPQRVEGRNVAVRIDNPPAP
ncbi:hypothetical protein DENIS_1461 [Desulfonema ishimotonii]|uniref:Pyrrolo-quinoline quinone repeat domain-containing protein n=2 Tax=Desulfonema ishimotonii TaxID=45657 RepID=A0A401FU77_9BACT|nr:hypothetical protein DENIS_1461 [Desulfonema ishimotonii]